jgi:uroporphyrinogen decarboxylase
MDDVVGIGIPAPADLPAIDYRPYYADRNLPADASINGDGVASVPSGFYHFWGYVHPLKNATSVEEIMAYPLRDYVGWPTDGLKARVAAAHASGKFTCGSVGHTYETAWQIRGYEEFLVDLMDQPAMACALLDRLMARNCIAARETARAGVDYILLGDDVANQQALMFPPTLWREIFKPRLATIIRAAREVNPHVEIWYHSDGNINDIIPDLIEVGVTILNPVQPECVDPVAIFREYGDRLVLDGTIGTQSVMPFGSVADVESTVARMIDQCGRSGGLVLAPTHVLEPEVPIANIEAFFRACTKYGNGR